MPIIVFFFLITTTATALTDANADMCTRYKGEQLRFCREIVETDQLLNSAYQKALASKDVDSQAQLRKKQREWLRVVRDGVCKLYDLPEDRQQWYQVLVQDPRKGKCVVQFSKQRIVKLQAETPGAKEKITEFSPSTLSPYLTKHKFAPSTRRSSAPAAFCQDFLEDLKTGRNIEYLNPTLTVNRLSRPEAGNVLERCQNLSLVYNWERYVQDPTYRLYRARDSQGDTSSREDGSLYLVEIRGLEVKFILEKFVPPESKCENYTFTAETAKYIAIHTGTCQPVSSRSNLGSGDTRFDFSRCKTKKTQPEEWTAIVRYEGKLAMYVFHHTILPSGTLKIVDPGQRHGWSYCEYASEKYRWRYPQ